MGGNLLVTDICDEVCDLRTYFLVKAWKIGCSFVATDICDKLCNLRLALGAPSFFLVAPSIIGFFFVTSSE